MKNGDRFEVEIRGCTIEAVEVSTKIHVSSKILKIFVCYLHFELIGCNVDIQTANKFGRGACCYCKAKGIIFCMSIHYVLIGCWRYN